MSLLSRIENNTNKVTVGKQVLSNKITSKGGYVALSNGVPSFQKLYDGIDSIPNGTDTISAGNGAIEVEATAKEDILQYDAVKILHGSGTTNFVGKTLLPRTAIDGESTVKLIYKNSATPTASSIMTTFISSLGTILCTVTESSSGNYKYYPFIKTEDGYKQLTIDGVYKAIPAYKGTTSSLGYTTDYHYNSVLGYDEIYRLFYTVSDPCYLTVYKLEDNNLVSKLTYNFGFSNATTTRNMMCNLICVNKHVFLNRIVTGVVSGRASGLNSGTIYKLKYNPDTNTWDSCNSIRISTNSSSSYADVIVDIAYPTSDTIYLCSLEYYRHATYTNLGYYITKLRLNSDNEYKVITKMKLQPSSSANPTSFTISYAGGKCFIISSSRIYQYLIEDKNDKLSATLLNNTEFFLDDISIFNPNAISYIRQVKGGLYLFCYSSDTSLEANKRLQLLEYQFGDEEAGTTSGYKLISYPKADFSPMIGQASTGYYAFPYNPQHNLNKDDTLIFVTSTSEAMLYKAGKDDKLYMHHSGNFISDEPNLYGYGIATESIANGNIGSASLNVIKSI